MAIAGRRTWIVWRNPSAAGGCFDGVFLEDLSEDEKVLQRVHEADPEWLLPDLIDLDDDEMHNHNGSWILKVQNVEESCVLEEIEYFEDGIRGYMLY